MSSTLEMNSRLAGHEMTVRQAVLALGEGWRAETVWIDRVDAALGQLLESGDWDAPARSIGLSYCGPRSRVIPGTLLDLVMLKGDVSFKLGFDGDHTFVRFNFPPFFLERDGEQFLRSFADSRRIPYDPGAYDLSADGAQLRLKEPDTAAILQAGYVASAVELLARNNFRIQARRVSEASGRGPDSGCRGETLVVYYDVYGTFSRFVCPAGWAADGGAGLIARLSSVMSRRLREGIDFDYLRSGDGFELKSSRAEGATTDSQFADLFCAARVFVLEGVSFDMRPIKGTRIVIKESDGFYVASLYEGDVMIQHVAEDEDRMCAARRAEAWMGQQDRRYLVVEED